MSVSGGVGGVEGGDLQRAQQPEPDSPGSRIFNPFAIAMQHVPAMAAPHPAPSAAVDAR